MSDAPEVEGTAWITALCCLPASHWIDPCISPAEYRVFLLHHEYDCRGHLACEGHARALREGAPFYGNLDRLESLRAAEKVIEVGTAGWVRLRVRPDDLSPTTPINPPSEA